MIDTSILQEREFSFGSDVENVRLVEEHVVRNYPKNQFRMSKGYGDDVMNYLKIYNFKRDVELLDLILACDGAGWFED
jgi:hypothetical protein